MKIPMQSGSTKAANTKETDLRWDMTSIYPSLESEKYKKEKNELKELIDEFSRHIDQVSALEAKDWLFISIEMLNRLYDLFETLGSYVYCQYSVDTGNSSLVQELNSLEQLEVPFKLAQTNFRNALAELNPNADQLVKEQNHLSDYRYFIENELFEQQHQMSPAEENLAAELNQSGGNAWGRLQETMLSQLTMTWDEKTGEQKSVVELRALAYDTKRSIRKKAFDLENAAFKSMEIPFAAALNGVKGFTQSINARKKYTSTLERSTHQSRISKKTLDALISSMKAFIPSFQKYLKAKAKGLGIEKMAFYDLFAPMGNSESKFSYSEAKDYIIKQFSGFSDELAEFAKGAFEKKWIDAESRKGKVGGAYCTGLPNAGESRILANFDGSFNSVLTLAHELGHGYHSDVLVDEAALNKDYPMTLAETASIFCETIVTNAALQSTSGEERLGILEQFISDSNQVIIDILSRFLFESAVMEKRVNGELSAEQFKELMIDAQKQTYGDGLDEKALHPYMWAVKGHYYRTELAFYNFPYAFGQLFGLGLYAQYQENPQGFPDRYRTLLQQTGKASAEDVCAKAGFDIETEEFWKQGLGIIENRINEFCKEVDKNYE